MSNVVQLIGEKRDGHTLGADEILEFVRRFSVGDIPDYQMSAMAMAIYLRGMDARETAALTEAMLESGTQLSWPTGAAVVDKHSTGGSGDKTSLILAPLLATCGLRVPMISGRGLGPTGGTLDKLESIAGFRTDLTLHEIQQTVDDIGCVITGATAEIAPADKKLYALRDVTATVASIPLITASIMSKKLAEGLQSLVLDVKFGSGAFMKTHGQAQLLARSLVDTGKRVGVRTSALLTDMNQPLGRMVGNAVEVQESIDTLKGTGPADLMMLTVRLGSELLLQSGVCENQEAADQLLRDRIDSGAAYCKFEEMVAAQGADLQAPRSLAPQRELPAERSGYVAEIDTEQIGFGLIALGGGRRVATDTIDHGVGIEMLVRLGTKVEAGEPTMRLFTRGGPQGDTQAASLSRAIRIDDHPPSETPLIVEQIQ